MTTQQDWLAANEARVGLRDREAEAPLSDQQVEALLRDRSERSEFDRLGDLVAAEVPCPPWCELPVGHPWSDELDVEYSRWHTSTHGTWRIQQLEAVSFEFVLTYEATTVVGTDEMGLFEGDVLVQLCEVRDGLDETIDILAGLED